MKTGSPLRPIAIAAVTGVLFGIGLAISQMIDPQKVKAFLDIAAIWGAGWDPSLAFVMGGGLLAAMPFFRYAKRLRTPLVATDFVGPTADRIDRRLVIGSALFGAGWGIAGLCPGPAIADLGLVPGDVALFVAAMLCGSWIATLTMRARSSRSLPVPDLAAF